MVRRNDYLIREAERIIDNYVKESKLKAGMRRRHYDNVFYSKGIIPLSRIINVVLGLSIIALLVLIINII